MPATPSMSLTMNTRMRSPSPHRLEMTLQHALCHSVLSSGPNERSHDAEDRGRNQRQQRHGNRGSRRHDETGHDGESERHATLPRSLERRRLCNNCARVVQIDSDSAEGRLILEESQASLDALDLELDLSEFLLYVDRLADGRRPAHQTKKDGFLSFEVPKA